MAVFRSVEDSPHKKCVEPFQLLQGSDLLLQDALRFLPIRRIHADVSSNGVQIVEQPVGAQAITGSEGENCDGCRILYRKGLARCVHWREMIAKHTLPITPFKDGKQVEQCCCSSDCI